MNRANEHEAFSHGDNESATFQERLRLIADNAPLLIAYIDVNGRYQFNNQAYYDWFGLKPSELRGRELREVIGEEAYHAIRGYVEAAFAGSSVTYEMTMPYARNGRRFVRTTIVPEKDAAGSVRGIMVFVSDDSALHEAQAQVISAYRHLVLTSNIGRVVRSASDPKSIMETTTAALGQSLNVDRCYYVTYDLQRNDCVVGPEWRREGIDSIAGKHKISDYSPNRNPNYLAGQTDVIEDALLLPDSAIAQKLGLRSVLRAPIQQEGRTTALVVAMATSSRKWTEQEIALVETTISQTRAAVEAAHASQRERAILRDVLASVTEGKLNLITGPSELPPPTNPVGKAITLTDRAGLHELRHRCKESSQRLQYSTERTYDLMTAVSEAGMNAIVHAGGGKASVHVSDSGIVQVRIEDHGKGIATMNLPKAALSRGYSTQGTLGHGLKMILEMCDRLYLLTGPSGTTVVLEQEREKPLPAWLSAAV